MGKTGLEDVKSQSQSCLDKIAATQLWAQNQIRLVYLWSCLTEAAPNPICATGFSPEETCQGGRRQETRQLLLNPLWAYHFLCDPRLSGDTMRATGQRRPDLVPEQTIASQCFPVSEPLLRPHLTAAPPVTTALSALSCRRTGEGVDKLFIFVAGMFSEMFNQNWCVKTTGDDLCKHVGALTEDLLFVTRVLMYTRARGFLWKAPQQIQYQL